MTTDKPTYREPTLVERLSWRCRRWRARHHQWAAWIEYLRWPTHNNQLRLDRADDLCRQLEDNRP